MKPSGPQDGWTDDEAGNQGEGVESTVLVHAGAASPLVFAPVAVRAVAKTRSTFPLWKTRMHSPEKNRREPPCPSYPVLALIYTTRYHFVAWRVRVAAPKEDSKAPTWSHPARLAIGDVAGLVEGLAVGPRLFVSWAILLVLLV